MPTLDAKAAEHTPLQILLYGRPKTGKTVFSASFPSPRFLDFDNGMLSVLWAIREGIVPWSADEIVYETIQETNLSEHGHVKAPSAVDRASDVVDEWLQDEEWMSSPGTIVIDSATALSDYCINLALHNMDQLKMSDSYAKGARVGMRVMARQDWGGAQSIFTKFIDWIRGLDRNIVLVCHDYEETTESGVVLSVQPALIGQLRTSIIKAFDEVYYMQVSKRGKDITHELVTRSEGKIVAGSRLGCFDPVEPNPSYQKLMAKVAKYRKEGTK